MTNHIVTPATAHALKAAGYPQPKPEAGQHWYDKQGNVFVLAMPIPATVAINLQTGEPVSIAKIFSGGFAYAPTATEIMEQGEMLVRNLEYYHGEKTWRACGLFNREDAHPNPAEAAATEYIKLKNQ